MTKDAKIGGAERFDPSWSSLHEMSPVTNGGWVRHEDYAALEAEVAGLRAQVAEIAAFPHVNRVCTSAHDEEGIDEDTVIAEAYEEMRGIALSYAPKVLAVGDMLMYTDIGKSGLCHLRYDHGQEQKECELDVIGVRVIVTEREREGE